MSYAAVQIRTLAVQGAHNGTQWPRAKVGQRLFRCLSINGSEIALTFKVLEGWLIAEHSIQHEQTSSLHEA